MLNLNKFKKKLDLSDFNQAPVQIKNINNFIGGEENSTGYPTSFTRATFCQDVWGYTEDELEFGDWVSTC